MRAIACVAVALLLAACGGRETPDDQGLHQDIVNGSNGAEITFDGTVGDQPIESGGHERFTVDVPTGDVLEIDHNTSLAQSVPLKKGDSVIVHGQLYIDPGPRYGVHCTHAHTSSGCPTPGWIEYNSNYYE